MSFPLHVYYLEQIEAMSVIKSANSKLKLGVGLVGIRVSNSSQLNRQDTVGKGLIKTLLSKDKTPDKF